MNKFITIIVLLAAALGIYYLTSTPTDTVDRDSNPQETETDLNWEEKTFPPAMVSARVPDSYRAVMNTQHTLEPTLNIYSTEFEGEFDFPLDPHSDSRVSHVSVFYEGFPSELPSGDRVPWNEYEGDLPSVSFEVNESESKVYLTEDATPWAYFVVPADKPQSWKQYGFIWAAISTDNLVLTCYDENTREEIPLDTCDPLTGDTISRSGTVDMDDAKTVLKILSSVELLSEDEIQPRVTELINVDQPLPNSEISSPLTVTGEAVGNWYFEGTFSLELRDAQGNVVAQGNAEAQGEWMTESFVPFTATLRYDNPPDDERGSLVFMKANPSGLEENAQSYSLPVLFPPSE